jgi:hypothetical protein
MTVNRHWSGTLEHPSLSDLLVKLISHQLGVPYAYAYADRTDRRSKTEQEVDRGRLIRRAVTSPHRRAWRDQMAVPDHATHELYDGQSAGIDSRNRGNAVVGNSGRTAGATVLRIVRCGSPIPYTSQTPLTGGLELMAWGGHQPGRALGMTVECLEQFVAG